MVKKLAVVISGAVSLGSYEAGVMYEVIEAIARHNENLPPDKENDRIEIDVLTGASAGGMTACILAQHLLCYDKSLREPYDNPLYNAWVKEVDIRQLLQVNKKNHIFSLLQSGVVEQIGKIHLLDKPHITEKKHPSAASEIQVGIAMSNLNGYTYRLKKSGAAKTEFETTEFGYTRYQDQFVCFARRDESDVTLKEMTLNNQNCWAAFEETDWKKLLEAGLSSGAFPFAFRAREIERKGAGKFEERDSIKHGGPYFYTDGGVFENEPIGMAQQLVNNIDNKNPQDPNRYYLFVAPGQRPLPENPFLDKEDDLLTVGKALLGAIFQQARFQEWILEGIKPPIFSVTVNDFELIGDVFSAFAGFLEKKFRAYDYNIGRERAQVALEQAFKANLIDYDAKTMPAISWTVDCKFEGEDLKFWDKNSKRDEDRQEQEACWKNAKEKLGRLAKPNDPKTGKIDHQLQELQRLMREVDEPTRKEILDQLTSRLDSFIDYLNDRIDDIEKTSFGGPAKILLRRQVGARLTKNFLKGLLEVWLRRKVLNL